MKKFSWKGFVIKMNRGPFCDTFHCWTSAFAVFVAVPLVSQSLPDKYVVLLLMFAALQLETSRHFEFYLTWIKTTLFAHGQKLKLRSMAVMPVLHTLQKALIRKKEDVLRTYVNIMSSQVLNWSNFFLCFYQSAAECVELGLHTDRFPTDHRSTRQWDCSRRFTIGECHGR